MGLIGIIGDSESYVGKNLVLFAAKHTPSLIIDCANIADPHSFFPQIDIEDMQGIYIIEVELIYQLRDALKKAESMASTTEASCIIVITSDWLFNYQDDLENQSMMEQAWQLMHDLGRHHNVFVGVKHGSSHHRLSLKYCDRLGVVDDGAYCKKPEDSCRYHH